MPAGAAATELKQLYVLCTRAKHCMLFWEAQHDVAQPMLDYWLAQRLVVRRPMGEDVTAMLRRASTPQEWRKRAEEFFNSK